VVTLALCHHSLRRVLCISSKPSLILEPQLSFSIGPAEISGNDSESGDMDSKGLVLRDMADPPRRLLSNLAPPSDDKENETMPPSDDEEKRTASSVETSKPSGYGIRGIIQSTTSYFLRATRLDVVSTLLDSDPLGVEEKKVIVQRSLWVSVSRCCVHFPPLAGTFVLLWYNFWGWFIGVQLPGDSFISDTVKFQGLQFASKAHELFIVASTAQAVFHLIRDQLLGGSGIPLGLIVSGFTFTELSFFWYVRPPIC
jgi:hypothetical protein